MSRSSENGWSKNTEYRHTRLQSWMIFWVKLNNDIAENEKGVTWDQVTPLKNFEGPSLLSIAKSILRMSILRPFPPISSSRWDTHPECVLYPFRPDIQTGHHTGVSLSIRFMSLQSTLPEFLSFISHPMRGTVLCDPYPLALYPYKPLFLSSHPSTHILCETPSIVVLIH